MRCLQDLFDDSEPIGTTTVQNDEKPDSPFQENFAPSLSAMDLKLDSVPVDDDRFVSFWDICWFACLLFGVVNFLVGVSGILSTRPLLENLLYLALLVLISIFSCSVR